MDVQRKYDPGSPGMSYVGFSDLPNLIHRKSVKKGFEFTLLVVGRDGTGKTTLVNTLFHTEITKNKTQKALEERVRGQVILEPSTVELEERGVKVRLTVVNTLGFGDSLDNSSNPEPIIRYIDDQFDKYFNDESGINRRHILDTRVHCLLYFIEPYQRGLKPLDIKFLKSVGSKVNVIPLIAKADTLTKQELAQKKKELERDIEKYDIKVYQMPDGDDDDPEYKETFDCIKRCMPFAVSGSTSTSEFGKNKAVTRNYPWGILEIENSDWTDCKALRTMIISQMSDLQEVTHNVHYENFRSERLVNTVKDKNDKAVKEKEAELKRLQEELARLKSEVSRKESNASATGADLSKLRDSRV